MDDKPTPPQTKAVLPSHLANTQPTELDLSPSKARAYASTTQAWTQVTTWLRDLTQPSPLPPFERNPATLAYLQSLMQANLAADDARRDLHEAQAKQVKTYEDTYAALSTDPGHGLLHEIDGELCTEARGALESLAEASVTLGCLPTTAGTADVNAELIERGLSQRLLELSADIFELEHVARDIIEKDVALQRLTEQIGRELVQVKENSESEEIAAASRRQQIAQYTAQTKHLGLKLAEYNQRIDVLANESQQGASVKSIRQRQKSLEVLQEVVRQLEQQVSEYHGLPPDVEASRVEVRRAQAELEDLKKQREELFSQMAGR